MFGMFKKSSDKKDAPRNASVPSYQDTIKKTVEMVHDQQVHKMLQTKGLQIMNVTWEDTGRTKDSCFGPNISDMTLQVANERGLNSYLPIIRHPNFSDKTADISPDKFYLLVGNERGANLHKITLTEYLKNFKQYLTNPASWGGSRTSLLAERDTHVLVSAQACFLPIPSTGKATFNPAVFNYQSVGNDPAVLAILVTREGTSATILGRSEDHNKLFFNENGKKASFTGQRASDFVKERKEKKEQQAKNNNNNKEEDEEDEDTEGLNMVLLIQVPLKQKNPQPFDDDEGGCWGDEGEDSEDCDEEDEEDNVEDAVIGHGEASGEFKEVDGIDIQRDESFPVRVTVQFYKATSNGVLNQASLQQIAAQINKVYDEADYVGSLVTEGKTDRPTEHFA